MISGNGSCRQYTSTEYLDNRVLMRTYPNFTALSLLRNANMAVGPTEAEYRYGDVRRK